MQSVPVSLPLNSPRFHRILDEQAVRDAWLWIVTNASIRPGVQGENCCVYDQKRWGQDNPRALLSDDLVCISSLARLFLTSQLTNDTAEIIAFVQGGDSEGVGIFTERIEAPIKALIEDEIRFRHALSEHIAFWMQLANILQSHQLSNFIVTPPNYLPEDKGPDGLSLAFDGNQRPKVELRSVKSSIKDPYYNVASGAFRKNEEAEPDPGKQLEEFYLISNGMIGFGRLDRLLTAACNSLNFSANKFIRSGILGNHRSFNATVVADDQYARYDMFGCFSRISPDPYDCIATYIGSDNWAAFAESVRICVLENLQGSGVL